MYHRTETPSRYYPIRSYYRRNVDMCSVRHRGGPLCSMSKKGDLFGCLKSVDKFLMGYRGRYDYLRREET